MPFIYYSLQRIVLSENFWNSTPYMVETGRQTINDVKLFQISKKSLLKNNFTPLSKYNDLNTQQKAKF